MPKEDPQKEESAVIESKDDLTQYSLCLPQIGIRLILVVPQWGHGEDKRCSELQQGHGLPEGHPCGTRVSGIVDQQS